MFESLIKNLEKNNMEVYVADTKADIVPIVKSLLKKGDVISCGGSMTLNECGVFDLMKNGDYIFLDRSVQGLTREEIMEIYRKTFSADAFLTSANAVTEKGELVNVDGNGNRVAAVTFGPRQVICIVGANKIVPDVEAAFRRVKTVAAPKNAIRLNTNTPCRTLGHCICPDKGPADGCLSPDRLCAHYAVHGYQRQKGRIKVILCPEELGY
ncbi:MAG: lactate utilization protein [Clostridia bacterium]|nr:lactate utilization protein [Clostridia bacterium]